MWPKVRSRLTYANVMATIAVFLALGGGAYAALRLPKNSVGSAQIKKNAVNSSKVGDGTLLARDFRARQLPAGAQGKQGPQGTQGPQGPQGVQGPKGVTGVLTRVTQTAPVPTGTNALASADCAPGEQAVGGGVSFEQGLVGPNDRVVASHPVKTNGSVPGPGEVATRWYGGIYNGSGSARAMNVYVLCVSP